MLLWILILAFFGVLVGELGTNLPSSLRARVLSVQGLIGAGFIAFLLFTSNPFLRLDPSPAQGSGLNPLLQDPGLAFHPPFLYLGYVGLSMAFSFAVAALIVFFWATADMPSDWREFPALAGGALTAIAASVAGWILVRPEASRARARTDADVRAE